VVPLLRTARPAWTSCGPRSRGDRFCAARPGATGWEPYHSEGPPDPAGAALEGDGAGYDVASFEVEGSERFIEVKTTRERPDTDCFVSANEVAFSAKHPETYLLYRLYALIQIQALVMFMCDAC